MSEFLPEEPDFDRAATLVRINKVASAKSPPENDARKSLVMAALMAVDTLPIRRALASAVPHVIVIKTPSHAWSRAMAAEIGRTYDDVAVTAVIESKKDGNQWAIDLMFRHIGQGQHQVFLTTDPLNLLPGLIHTATDVSLIVPPVDDALLQRAIRTFTGKSVRGGVDAEITKLDFPVLQLALRPGSSARDCLLRLRRSAARPGLQPAIGGSYKGPALEDLPLPADIAGWAYATAEQLKAVTAGTLDPAALQHGVLAGEPGTGKTLVAGALAKSAGWAFHATSIGSWFNSSDGNLGGVSRACVAFFDAILSKEEGVVAFLDECDALPSRAALKPSDLQWWSTLINLMLTQIDRLRGSGKPVLLLAATNYFERLDPGLVRAGRLEQHVHVRVPRTEEEVLAIFAYYLKGEIESSGLAGIERFALGATPAMIAAWIRTARAAARSEGRALTKDDVVAAVVPPDRRSPEEIRAVALHEAGHAVVAWALGIGVDAVSIVSHGSAGGITKIANASSFPNREELEETVTVLLAGRAADLVVGTKGAHSGAAIDLDVATSLLLRGRYHLGLYETLAYSQSDGKDAFEQVNSDLERLLERAVSVVTNHRAAVLALADVLVERRLLDRAQIEGIISPLVASKTEGNVAVPVMSKTKRTPAGPKDAIEETPNGRLG